MGRYNDLRAWGVWFDLIEDLTFVSVNRSESQAFIKIAPSAVRDHLRLVRLDLSPLYKDTEKTQNRR